MLVLTFSSISSLFRSMRRYFAELIGTFTLVFVGTGAILSDEISGGEVTHVGVSLTFGLAVMAMIYSIGNVSGAHINPAVTLAFSVAGRISRREVFPYVVAQLLGALLASGLIKVLFWPQLVEAPAGSDLVHLGSTQPIGAVWQAFLMELILTYILMFVILNVSTGSKETGILAGIAVGGVVALAALFAGPICGASMNPARSIGPALLSGNVHHLWIYLLAPILGAIAAVPTCCCVQMNGCCSPPLTVGQDRSATECDLLR